MIKECKEFVTNLTPVTDKKNVIIKGRVRISVLTERLLRIEESENGDFIDAATQIVVNRKFADPHFTVTHEGEGIVLRTEYLTLYYKGGALCKNSLSIRTVSNSLEKTWNFGEEITDLQGTARTLDSVDGPTELDHGIVSKEGFAVLDDSESFLFTEDGWLKARDNKNKDFYFFGYGHDYIAAFKDFFNLCGKPEILPRFVFGNWWSRFYPYSEESYEKLMDEFEERSIPLSCAVIDMDWHLTDIPKEIGGGWTGYTWNPKYFPDPKRFLDNLHKRNLHTTLNVHPADGVRYFEKNYDNLCRKMGMDPEKKECVRFAPEDKKFLENYFNEILHPMEEEGVDFWWIDWQQGRKVEGSDVDPLWVLNHTHFLDSKRNGKKGLTFSRYAGPGSHRYPIGFSGDTMTTWESLRFQPFFTANATNIGYTYWSHDIGGHQFGKRNDEMTVRWVQLGVFSPIMRLHSTANAFYGKEPWNYGPEAEKIISEYMRLRHRLIPYIYSMNYLTAEESEPLIRPLYYIEDVEEAYEFPNEFGFGTQMIVHPITEERDREALLTEIESYLPKGTYYDFFTGLKYEGGRRIKVYRHLDETPVFVKAGGIVPLDESFKESHLKNPVKLEVRVYEGSDGNFTLYEDDNSELLDSKKAKTVFTYDDEKKLLSIKVNDSNGILPEERSIRVIYTGKGTLNIESDVKASVEYEDLNNKKKRIFDILNRAQVYYDSKEKIYRPLNKPEVTKEDFDAAWDIALKEDIPAILKDAIREILDSADI